ncbi:peptidylprolyl isomerase [Pelagibacterales bacterium SAG-MED08]|nr:peptidylprolyl isomerase [Pelagibacterales bacterium SAG-MED08]
MKEKLIDSIALTYKLKILLILFVLIVNKNATAIENRIIVKVDNKLITSVDIYNQSRYLTTLDPDLKKFDDNQIFELSKNLLIKEKIKKIELEKQKINMDIKDEMLNSYVNSIFRSKNIYSVSDYRDFINLMDFNYEQMREKLVIEFLWNNLIFKKYSSNIKIDRNELKELVKNKKINSYLLSEIVFDAKNKGEINKKYQKIKLDIDTQSFNKAALIHSVANSASNGGNIGWIKENSLNKKILKVVNKLEINKYSKPISLPGGFLVVMLKDKKSVTSNLDPEKELNSLVQFKTNQQLNQFSNMHFNKVKKEIQINEL